MMFQAIGVVLSETKKTKKSSNRRYQILKYEWMLELFMFYYKALFIVEVKFGEI